MRPPVVRLDRKGHLAWMVGLMVWLATLALGAGLFVHQAVVRWEAGLVGTLTVQVPANVDARLDPLLERLKAQPGVLGARVLAKDEAAALVEPWLGPGAAELPLPFLVDLRVGPSADVPALRRVTAETMPGASLDDHRRWVDRLVRAATAIEIAAGLAVLLVGAATVLAVIVATRAGLSAERDAVELLHLVGARDGWIARQVQRQALLLALKGGTLGLALALLTAAGLFWALGGEADMLLPALELGPAAWVALLAVLPAAGLLAMLTARIAVLRALAAVP